MSEELEIPIAAQHISFWELKQREDGRGSKGRAGLTATLSAVADVQRQRLGKRRLEGDGAALTASFHDGQGSRGSRCEALCGPEALCVPEAQPVSLA